MTCVSSSNRKARGKKWFLLNQVFLVCISWTQRGMDCCLCQLQKNPHSCFPFLETEGSPALGIRPLGPERCDALPSSWHTSWAVRAGSGSHASALRCQLRSPGTEHPPAGGRTSPQGQPRTVPQVPVVMTELSTPLSCLVPPCSHFPLRHTVFDDAVPHPGCDLVSGCHVPI